MKGLKGFWVGDVNKKPEVRRRKVLKGPKSCWRLRGLGDGE